jgi:hypothetical protein
MIVAESYQGIVTGDLERFRLKFWELTSFDATWVPFRTTISLTGLQDGCRSVLRWEAGTGSLHRYAMETRKQLHDMHESGNRAWLQKGIAINRMSGLQATVYYGEHFDNNVAVLIPREPAAISALLAYCVSSQFVMQVKKLDRTLKVTNKTLVKVPFDLAHWQKVAVEKYPHGLPKPFSNDSTQWLFDGHPRGSSDPNMPNVQSALLRPGLAEHPLQVAVARLLGYRWPRQTGSSFMDCPAITEPDEIDTSGLVSGDGIVCLPSLHGEGSAAERLRALLAHVWSKDWADATLRTLLVAESAKAADLDTYLADEFFDAHCKVFHQTPFILHVWDGVKA